MKQAISYKIQNKIREFKQKTRIAVLTLTNSRIRMDVPIICFGHLRSATRSTGRILQSICDELNWNCYWGYQPISSDAIQKLTGKYHIIYLHRTQLGDYPEQFSNLHFRGFHIYRDPRNLLVSAYYSYRDTHELNQFTADIANIRPILKELSTERGMIHIMDHSKQFRDTMAVLNNWDFNNPNLTEIKFEEYVKNVEEYWHKILTFLNVKLDQNKLNRILNLNSFHNLKQISTHYRSAAPDDHKKEFSPLVKTEFKKRYGNLLIQMGYESNLDW